MAAWTLQTAQEMLAVWLDAEKAVALSQEYEIRVDGSSSRKLTRTDADEITNKINYWRREVESLEKGLKAGPKISRFVPIDV